MSEPSTIETAALVALLRIGKRPWSVYTDLVDTRGSAEAILREELAAETDRSSLFEQGDAARSVAALIARAAADLDVWSEEGMRVLTVLDPDYPENLRTVHDRPPLIFVAGRLTPTDPRSIAVVGARQATPTGLARARAIAEHLSQSGYTVASGLASGIDTAAHTAALASGGRTIAVIGTGLRRSYPPENARLQRRIAEECAVISQFWPNAPPTRRTFPMRNATMSGLTLATVVVEASHTSGSRMQARLALEHGRPVFLVDSLMEQAWARDCATRPGTRVVRFPEEITNAVERLTSSNPLVA
ncbi:MAG: DNA-protecting protein DprA [Actinomycetota bacterium]|nr:DNA-protecting protein DprA [Actinomycetota bacterium]